MYSWEPLQSNEQKFWIHSCPDISLRDLELYPPISGSLQPEFKYLALLWARILSRDISPSGFILNQPLTARLNSKRLIGVPERGKKGPAPRLSTSQKPRCDKTELHFSSALISIPGVYYTIIRGTGKQIPLTCFLFNYSS